MEGELIIRNKFLQYNNSNKHNYDTTDNTWLLSQKKGMFEHPDINSDHTVPSSREIMEARERRMKQAQQQVMSINTIEVPRSKEETAKDLYLVDSNKLHYDNFGIAMKHEHVDNLSGYTVPVDSSDDICVEEILVGLGDASDGWYHPSPYHYERPRKHFNDVRVPSQDHEITPPASPYYPFSVSGYARQPLSAYSPNNANLVPAHKRRKVTPPQSPEDEPRLVESSDEKEHYQNIFYDEEVELDSLKRKAKKIPRMHKKVEGAVVVPSVMQPTEGATYEEVGGVCGKTNKPRQRKEYFYSKNSKTIFRWTCCGSQAKDHPEF